MPIKIDEQLGAARESGLNEFRDGREHVVVPPGPFVEGGRAVRQHVFGGLTPLAVGAVLRDVDAPPEQICSGGNVVIEGTQSEAQCTFGYLQDFGEPLLVVRQQVGCGDG